MVRVNGRVAAAGDKGQPIGPDDVIEVSPEAGRVPPEPAADWQELARGGGWVVAEKPIGQAVHPLREGETGTLLNAAVARYPEIQGVGQTGGEGGLKSGVVHRLDVETSGALLLARDEPMWQRLRHAFTDHEVEKQYVAVVAGQLQERGRADLWLAVTRHRPARVERVGPGHPAARRCTLGWRVRERYASACRIEIDLGTGFLHQIRATFAARGHPVVGDPVYAASGDPPTPPSAGRMLLHATSLRWREIAARSPLPEAFADFARHSHG
jgi:23S rRNA pseudouridine1911/1915/1917 synthase